MTMYGAVGSCDYCNRSIKTGSDGKGGNHHQYGGLDFCSQRCITRHQEEEEGLEPEPETESSTSPVIVIAIVIFILWLILR